MRIEINSSAMMQLNKGLGSLHQDIDNTIESLQKTNTKFNNLSGGIQRLSSAQQSLQNKIAVAKTKKTNLENIINQAANFCSNTIETDKSVAQKMRANRETFYNQYPWARPPEPEKKSWFEERMEDLNEFWESAKETLKNVWQGIVEYVKEHAVEIIIGTIAITVAAVLTVLSGGTLGPLFLGILKGVLISGGISGLIAGITGGDIIEGVLDGFASGYMFSGIFSAISSGITAFRFVGEGGKLTIRNYTDGYKHYTKKSLDLLKNTENYSNYGKTHIFEGNINPKGQAVGYHYEAIEGSAGKIISGSKSVPNMQGVYHANVKIDGITKLKGSTFFPKTMSPQQVVNAINEVFITGEKITNNIGKVTRIVGSSTGGLDITIFIDHFGKIMSAFPKF